MARRRMLAIDTSDGLANVVLGTLAVLILASLALIPLIGSADEQPAEQTDEVGEVVVPPADADPDAVVPEADPDAADADLVDPDGTVVDPDATVVDPDATVVDPDAAGADLADPDAIAVDPDGSGADTDAVPDAPVDSLTVEGAASTAAGLVSAAPAGGDTADGGDVAGDPAAPATEEPDVALTPAPSPAPEPDAPPLIPLPERDETPPIPPPEPDETPPEPDVTPPAGTPPPPDDGEVVIPPEPDGDRYEPDDPDRIPAVTISTTPRDKLSRRVDVDGDGVPERVWAAIVADVVHIRVDELVDGRWRYGPVHRGPVADRLVDLRIADLTGDGLPEIWTWQWVATEGQSVTLWSYEDGELQRMDAIGGCWSGSNTFGLVGALVQRATPGRPIQIAAICEEPTLPWWQWPSALYRWEDGRWTINRLVGKYR